MKYSNLLSASFWPQRPLFFKSYRRLTKGTVSVMTSVYVAIT